HDLEHGRSTLGAPSTVVRATELSEDAIVSGLRSGRAFVRSLPDARLFVDLTASTPNATATMGGSIAPGPGTLCVRGRGAAGMRCEWMRRGVLLRSSVIRQNDWIDTIAVDAARDDWFSVIVRHGRTAALISNAIYVGDNRYPASPRNSQKRPADNTIDA